MRLASVHRQHVHLRTSIARRQERQRLSVRRPRGRTIMPALRKLRRFPASRENNPDVARVAIRTHVRRRHGKRDPFTVRRYRRVAYPVHLDHVVKRNRVLRGFLRQAARRTTQNQPSGDRAAPQNVAHHDFSLRCRRSIAIAFTMPWILSRFPAVSKAIRILRAGAHCAPASGRWSTRAQNKFAPASANVARTTTPSPHRTVVSSRPVKASATTANAVPPGDRNVAPPGFFRRNAGNAAATAPYINNRATAESVAFHRKSPEIENISSNTANARIEMCGVRNFG